MQQARSFSKRHACHLVFKFLAPAEISPGQVGENSALKGIEIENDHDPINRIQIRWGPGVNRWVLRTVRDRVNNCRDFFGKRQPVVAFLPNLSNWHSTPLGRCSFPVESSTAQAAKPLGESQSSVASDRGVHGGLTESKKTQFFRPPNSVAVIADWTGGSFPGYKPLLPGLDSCRCSRPSADCSLHGSIPHIAASSHPSHHELPRSGPTGRAEQIVWPCLITVFQRYGGKRLRSVEQQSRQSRAIVKGGGTTSGSGDGGSIAENGQLYVAAKL